MSGWNQVAGTIYDQLGGRRFSVMTGAKQYVQDENSLRFRIGRNSKSINVVRITLTPMDLYHIEFIRVRGSSYKVVSEVDDIYADQLQDVFTDHTGLYTHF